MRKLKVDLPTESYPIFVGRQGFEKFAELLGLYGFTAPAVIVTDRHVDTRYGDALQTALAKVSRRVERFVLPAGEKAKTLTTVERILTRLLEGGYHRDLILVAFGGGVIGDVTGFVASVFKRGVRILQLPTTLLAQVDASIGGKTAVNHRLGKNQIGTFYQPRLVWSDVTLLKSLPKKEILCGLGEIFKYGAIRDTELFAFAEQNLSKIFDRDLDVLEEIVYRCSAVKAAIVAQDEKDSDIRMILNFGHTVGHALEACQNYRSISHGEAVLLGMLAESKIAVQGGLLPQAEFKQLERTILSLDLKLKNPPAIDAVLATMQSDKKIAAGKITMILPERIGHVQIVDDVEEKLIRIGVKYLFSLF